MYSVTGMRSFIAGITSMQGTGLVKRKANAKKKPAKQRKKQARLLNEHLANSELLKEYDADGLLVEQGELTQQS
jgi:hypothetical protein